MVTTVDRLAQVGGRGEFSDTSVPYFAQTFVAAGYTLKSVEFLIDTDSVYPDATEYRVLITTATTIGGQFHPGAVLFESALLVDPRDVGASYALVKVDTDKVSLVPGATYAFIFDAAKDADGDQSGAYFGTSFGPAVGTPYFEGFLATLSISDVTGDRTTDFGKNWFEDTNYDLSFRLVFGEPGVTIVGTKKADVVDASQTVGGYSMPTENDDSISGLGGRDKLSGLGGDDTLDGGKGKDQLTGGGGADQFKFSVGLKQPADKIIDFSPADDTILLAAAKFSGLAVGTVSEAVFRDVGEGPGSGPEIIYKTTGKLLFDNGHPGSEPHAFAKLVGAPNISAADLLVV